MPGNVVHNVPQWRASLDSFTGSYVAAASPTLKEIQESNLVNSFTTFEHVWRCIPLYIPAMLHTQHSILSPSSLWFCSDFPLTIYAPSSNMYRLNSKHEFTICCRVSGWCLVMENMCLLRITVLHSPHFCYDTPALHFFLHIFDTTPSRRLLHAEAFLTTG